MDQTSTLTQRLTLAQEQHAVTPPIDTHRYKIVRMFFNEAHRKRTVASGLTLADAQAHCKNPETSSSTCKGLVARNRTKTYGPWFDGYEQE